VYVNRELLSRVAIGKPKRVFELPAAVLRTVSPKPTSHAFVEGLKTVDFARSSLVAEAIHELDERRVRIDKSELLIGESALPRVDPARVEILSACHLSALSSTSVSS
jgi:hypothetical protein